MVKGLLRLRDNREKLELTVTWSYAEKLVEALEPVGKLTRKMQAVHYVMGDLYNDIAYCQAELLFLVQPPNRNEIANSLAKHMDDRKKVLFACPAVLAGLYLDPRVKKLKDSDIEIAIKSITDIGDQLSPLC